MGLYTEIKVGPLDRPGKRIVEGLSELARSDLVKVSGLCLTKQYYGGRYLNWLESDVPQNEWPLFLRHYLLRHLLELHFSRVQDSVSIELVLDRVSLSESQRANLIRYLDSKPEIPLSQPFAIPRIEELKLRILGTWADCRLPMSLRIWFEMSLAGRKMPLRRRIRLWQWRHLSDRCDWKSKGTSHSNE